MSKVSEAGRVTATNASNVTPATNFRKPHPIRTRTFKHIAMQAWIQLLRKMFFLIR